MTPLKFIHAADLHIDSPLRGLDAHEGAPVERLRGATRQAFVALVDLALAQPVDFVILAGDIYDGDWTDFRTGLFFREQLVRLTRAGLRVFIARGNHDAESQITRQLQPPDGVHVFSARTCETVDLADLGVALHGRSFPDRAVTEDLVPGYNEPVPGRVNIGVLHTSLTGYAEHDPYAPTSLPVLCAKGYDYFALGHVHARQVVREADPRIVFPGNLQGRHARETGPKGCELVTVAGGRLTAEFVPLDVVRWHQAELDVSGVADQAALSRQVASHLEQLAAGTRDRLHAVRLLLQGESALHRLEARQPGALAAAVQAAVQDIDDGMQVWIEQVQLELRAPLDRAAAAARPDALGEVVRLVDALAADEAQLKAWVAGQLGEMTHLPRELADADPTLLTSEAMRAALADAEASVLAQLSDLADAADGARVP